jgi:hypothetical protein
MTVLRVRNTTCLTSPTSARTAYGERLDRVREADESGDRSGDCSGVWDQPISHLTERSIDHVVNLRAVRRNHPDQPAGRGGCGRGVVEKLTESLSSPGLTTASAVDPNQVIDQVFDFAEKILEVQREFAKNLASTAAAAGETTRQQAEAAMKTVQDQTK